MPTKTSKYKTKLCNDTLTFEDCELAILRHAVDEGQEILKRDITKNDDILRMIHILEAFLIRKRLIVYGGLAINSILPAQAQFYDKKSEVPDYDFYSSDALADAKELADLYHREGYSEVEAKSGMHYGTFKVFVNFIPIADITLLPKPLFDSIARDAIVIAGIRYSPPNFLRMNMYLELSRPAGDTSRWEKVLKRLTLLNEYYPLEVDTPCSQVDFQRQMDDAQSPTEGEEVYQIVRDSFVDQGVVFIGGFAISMYSKYMPKEEQKQVRKIPDFDVISTDPVRTVAIVTERLRQAGIRQVRTKVHDAIGEIVPRHHEISVGKDIVAFVYEPIACHNYNEVTIDGRSVHIGTIDTLLTFYLAFYYADKPYYYRDRLMCMTKFMFEVQRVNRLEQKGLLKRFSIDCYGKQPTLEEIRAEKTKKFKELMAKPQSEEHEMWFLRYNPGAKTEPKPVRNARNDQKPQKTVSARSGKKRLTLKRRKPWWLKSI